MTLGSGALRVGVNLMWCLPGEVGGSEQYLVRQLAGLDEAAGDRGVDLDVTLFATAAMRERYSATLPGFSWQVSPGDGLSRGRRIVDESTWLHRRSVACALVHHGGGTAPLRARRPYVLTIHDLQYRTFPDYFSTLKRRWFDVVIPRSVRGAAVVTVPTEYVRATVVDLLGAPPERVVVVPHGYEPELLAERTPEAELRHRLHLGDGRVLVYPAMTAPHKNHLLLVELMRRVWTDPDLRLVLIGGRGRADAEVEAAIVAAGAAVTGRIVRAGRVSDADRNGLLAMATALVFPSRYEGFGAPLIEAMALGAPIVCSDATCLPDVAGDAAVVLAPTVDAWSGALDEVARRRDDLVAAGHVRAGEFTARRSGDALLGAYTQAVGR